MGTFEVLPFRFTDVGRAEEIRRGGGAGVQMGVGKREAPAAAGSRRMVRHGPLPASHAPYRLFGGYSLAPGSSTDIVDNTRAPTGFAVPSEQIRWVQFALNQAMNAGLPTDGIASPEFRTALRGFQGRQGLPVSGFVGPDTIAALRRGADLELEFGWENMVARAPARRSGVAAARREAARKKQVLRDFFAKTKPYGEPKTWAERIDEELLNATPFRAPDLPDDPAKPIPPTTSVTKSSGLYRISFPYGGETDKGVYIGKADKMPLPERLQDHIKEARHMGCSLAHHRFQGALCWRSPPGRLFEGAVRGSKEQCRGQGCDGSGKPHCVN